VPDARGSAVRALLTLPLLLCAVLAQQPPPTFRTTTRLVEVPVVVTDRAGRPVPGLTRDDFELTEDGKPQAISVFDVLDTRAVPSRPVAPVDEESDEASPHFTNHVPRSGGSAVVILLDRLNAGLDSQWFAKIGVDRALKATRPDDRIALYALDGGIRVLHDLTTDAASLRRALEQYQARVSGAYDASTDPAPNLLPPGPGETVPVWLVNPSLAVSEFYQRERWRSTFESLQALAAHLAGVEGRKSIVWVSEVFPIPTGWGRSEFLEWMRKTTRALSAAQAALYPVDSRGLVGAISYTRTGEARFNTFGAIRGNIETMEVMAEDTGGRPFANSNALDVSVRRALDDSRLLYLLGYHPSDARADGRFRSIDVKLKRRGLTVRARAGYVAAETPSDQKARDAALKEALRGPLTATQVGLSARTAYSGESALNVALTVDASTITLEQRDGLWRGEVDVLVAEVTKAGLGSIVRTERMELSIPNERRAGVLASGIPLALEDLRTTRYLHELRIVARDVPSGRVGSLVISAAALRR
jgi:VWFA-related protein